MGILHVCGFSNIRDIQVSYTRLISRSQPRLIYQPSRLQIVDGRHAFSYKGPDKTSDEIDENGETIDDLGRQSAEQA
jgi:hypothetical protein